MELCVGCCGVLLTVLPWLWGAAHRSPLAGELLRVTHLARGADGTGSLRLDSVISGSVPESFGDAVVLLKVLMLPIIPMGPQLLYWEHGGSMS